MGGDALPLSCVACVGLKVSLRGGGCVCVCLLCLIFVFKNCSNSLVGRTHCLVRSILDTIKRRMCQCRSVTELVSNFCFVLGKLFVPVNVCLWEKLFVGSAHTKETLHP